MKLTGPFGCFIEQILINNMKQVRQTVKAFKNFHSLFKCFHQTGYEKGQMSQGQTRIPGNVYHSERYSFEVQQLRITLLLLYLRKTWIIAQFEFRVIMD